MPAVYDLANRGLLPPGFALVGLRPPRLGGPGLRAGRARRRQGARAHPVPRGGLAAARPRACASSRASSTTTTAFERLREHHREARRGARHGRQPRLLPLGAAELFPMVCSSSRSTGCRAPRTGRLAPRGHREAVRPRPGQRPGAQPGRLRGLPRRTRCSGSTTTWARRRSRTSWRCGSPTSMFEPIWNRTTSTTCRSPWPRTSASAAAPATTTASAPRATSSRTTCSSCSR